MGTVCLLVLGAAHGAAADSITLEWDPSGETVGYKVHVGVVSGSYSQHYDVGPSTTFTFPSATAGQRYCFAVSAYALSSMLEGPNSAEICGYSNEPPTLANPGNRTSTVGQAVTLQLVASDPASQPLTYSATGLPPGLSLMSSTGYISGAGTTAGSYSVTAQASDGVLTASQTFTWAMTAPAGDTTPPTATISTPTNGTTYSTTSSTMSLGGTASDTVGVTQVRWASDRGFSGVAGGTTNWSVSGIPLSGGANVITITAVDAAGNQGTDVLTVTYTATIADTTLPTVSIATPTSGTTFSTSFATINLTGSASDNVGVTQVSWANDRGGNGLATGTTSWAIGPISLQGGTNILTVMAIDAAGNASSDTLMVSYSEPALPPPSTSVTLTAERSGSRTISLTWTGASWSRVSVYRDGVKTKEMRNNGSASDNPPKGGGTFNYKVCSAGSTTICSNTATLSF